MGMFETIYFLCIILIFAYLIYNYIKVEKNKKDMATKEEYNDLERYFYDNLKHLKHSSKRKIWIHVPFEKNSRKWLDFGSRNSNELNIPYVYLCLKSVIDKCGMDYDVIIYNDSNICNILDDCTIDLTTLSGEILEEYRKLMFCKILYEYGGVIMPFSFFCKKSIKEVDNTELWWVSEVKNQGINVSQKNGIKSIELMGSSKKNENLNEFIEKYKETLKKDFGMEHSTFITDNLQYISYLDGKIIGTKGENNKFLGLEDLMSNNKINMVQDNVGIYVPHKELLRRRHYNWFCYLSTDDLLISKTFLSEYMSSNI